MKKLILFLFLLAVENVSGQIPYPCDIFYQYGFACYNGAFIDTLNIGEDSTRIAIDPSNSCNTWILGHSYKTVFDSVTSPLGLVTDTLLPYDTGVNCSFTIKHPLQDNIAWGNPVLSFEHKYETDSLFDGGYLEYSCDNGQNWIPVSNPQHQVYYNNYLGLPDSQWNQTLPLINGNIPVFTGTNGDWQWSRIQWIFLYAVAKPDENRWQECEWADTLLVRFVFDSDSIDNSKAGWMIRNIVFGWTDIGGSISEFSTHPLKLFPNPTTEKISVELPPNSGELSGVVISDIAGNVALRTTEARAIDVSTLSPGIYFVLVETDKLVFRQKFIKQ